MLDTVFLRAAGLSALLAAAAAHAGPITTVPWNGYTGAVSFTYDDARGSQLTNLIPALDAIGLKATFFVTTGNAGGNFSGDKSKWLAAAKNGHELGNHTSDHNSPNNNNVTTMASTLRGLDPSVEAVTFAYPGCTVTGTSAVSAESFMGRGCGDTKYDWGTQPGEWMNIQGLILGSSGANVSTGISSIDAAKSNKWATMIVHDVGGNLDGYSLSVADNKKLLDQAINNKLWIATYQEVGAYYRAHFTMDNVTASSGSGPWSLKWTSPHAKMPKSVKLKVKLDAATFGSDITVSQGGTAIAKNTDGSYTIEFMKLALDIKKGTSGIADRAINLEGVKFRREANGIAISGAPQARISVWTLSGTQVGLTEMDSHGAGWLALGNASSGSLVVRVAAQDGASSSVILPPVR